MIIPSHPNTEPQVSDRSPATAPVKPAHDGGVVTGGVVKPKDAHYDPAGNPITFGCSSVRDQQAGGNLTGDNPDRRDDNFMADTPADATRQLQRDGALDEGIAGAALPDIASHIIEPDGTEDPLANIDDGLFSVSSAADDRVPKTKPGKSAD